MSVIRHPVFANIMLLAAYLSTAVLTLSLTLPPVEVTPVWIPSGVALGAILIWGYRLLPAVFLGDCLVAYYLVGGSDWTALYICLMFGLQAMLHAWLAAWWLQHRQLWPNPLIDDKAILQFFWIAAGLSMAIATLVFGLSQWLIGRIASDQLFPTLFMWWIGGAIGVVLFTPIVLVLFAKPRDSWKKRVIPVLLPLTALLVLLITVLYYARFLEHTVRKREFASHVSLAQHMVVQELQKSTLLLQVMRSYFRLSQIDSAVAFQDYLHEFVDNKTDIDGVGWIDYVDKASRSAYEAQHGGPILELDAAGHKRVASERDFYLVIRFSHVVKDYVQPLHLQQNMNLFDLCFTPERARLCQRILKDKKATILPPILDTAARTRFVYVLPVLSGDHAVIGAVGHMYAYQSLFSSLLPPENRRWLEFSVMDVTNGSQPVLLFQSQTDSAQVQQRDQNWRIKRIYHIGGRSWQFSYVPSALFMQVYTNRTLYWIVTVALVVLSLISIFLLSMTGKLQWVSREVETKTRQLRDSEKKYRSLVEGIEDEYIIYSHNVVGIFDYVSPSVSKILGYTQQQFLTHYGKYMPDSPLNREVEYHTQLTLAGHHSQYELEIWDSQGVLHILSINENPRFDEKGSITGVEGIAHDITRLRKTQKELEKLSLAVEHNPNGIMIMDHQGMIEYVNPRFTEITGFQADELIGQHSDILKSEATPQAVYQQIWEQLSAGQTWHGELQSKTKKGTVYWARGSISPLFDQHGKLSHFIATHEDVTFEKRKRDETSRQASHDPLTGLINRREFEVRLQRIIQSAREDVSEHALCFMDLDRFKAINDSCGHVAGDELLRQIGELLQANVRQRDTLARFGGDEFALLMEHCSIEQAYEACQKIIQLITDFRFHWEDRVFTVGISIGLAAINRHIQDSHEVLGYADSACYAAKNAGRNRVEVHSEDNERLLKRQGDIQWHNEINAALDADRFQLYAQMIKPLQDPFEAPGYEVLLRLQLADGKTVPPGAFLPAAERYNLSIRIDRWVITHCLHWLSQHKAQLQHIDSLAINLSGHSIGDEAMLGFIIRELQQSDVPTEKVKFEITETTAIANLRDATVFIHTLREMGCRFALDDFGSGLSSFAYLKNLQVDVLKIDGMFIKDLLNNPIDLEMVKSINEIAHVMGLKTIAEFVEDGETEQKLREIHIDYAQGHAISEPVPVDKILG